MSSTLLDTHTILWLSDDSARLSTEARKHIQLPGVELFVSYVSAWEIAIKAGIGKLKLPQTPEDYLSKHLGLNGIRLLPISLHSIFLAGRLPLHHRDPFDRLLVAQCLYADIPIISHDIKFDAYGVKRIW